MGLAAMAAAVAVLVCAESARGKAPAEFDCGIRQLAVEYAHRIQPFRSRASMQALVDTLNLRGGLPGGEAQCFNATVPDSVPQSFAPNFSIPSGQPAVFVDAARGDDAAKGSLDAPFRTVARALEETRKQQPRRRADGTGFAIVLRAGTHYLGETIELGPDDAHLTFQNYQGEDVWLSGARAVEAPSWARHPSKENVWQLALPGWSEATGLRLGRRRAVRARYPNGCESFDPLPSGYTCRGSAPPGGVVDPRDGFGSSLLSDWIRADQPTMNQSHWFQYTEPGPERKSGMHYHAFQLGAGGSCRDYDPPAGYWCGNQCYGGAPAPPGCIIRFPKGVSVSKLPNAPYRKPGTAVVQSWHPLHWSSWMFQVSGTQSNATHLVFDKGGFQGGRGGDVGEAFFVENVEEELDAENEFFFDEDTSTLLYFSRGGTAPEGRVEVPIVKTLFRLSGDQADPVRDVHFLGLGFRDTRLTFLDNHTQASGGDWGVNLRAAFELRGVERTVINSCTFADLDGNAVLVKGYARGVVIQNNEFRVLGGNIIAQLGETEAPGLPREWGFGWNGTAGNQPRGTIVRSNFAHRCGLFAKQSAFYFQAKSMGTVLQSNVFFHGPRAGININDGFGGGNLLEGNLLFATVMETGDHGPFNSWDRQPYAHAVDESGAFVMEKDFDEVRGNFMMGNYNAQEVVDNDDGSNRFHTHHNLLVYGDVGLKSDFGGHSNHHNDNLYAYLNGFAFNTQGHPIRKGEEDALFNGTIILGSSAKPYANYDCDCAERNQACPRLGGNRLFTPDGTTPRVCNQSLAERAAAGLDVGTTVAPWPSPAQVLSWARDLLGLTDRPDAAMMMTTKL